MRVSTPDSKTNAADDTILGFDKLTEEMADENDNPEIIDP